MIAEKLYDLLPAEWPKVIGDLPATSQEVVGIVEYDGCVNLTKGAIVCADRVTTVSLAPIVKVVIRSLVYEQGQLWANAVKSTLHRYHDDTMLSVLLVGAPIYIGRTTEKLHEFQVTFKIKVKE